MSELNETPTERGKRLGCYCGVWDKSPENYKSRHIPEGFCGFCSVCGEPGHTRHFPGNAPYTACWCDKHYRRTMIFHPRGFIGGCMIRLLVLAFVIWLVVQSVLLFI